MLCLMLRSSVRTRKFYYLVNRFFAGGSDSDDPELPPEPTNCCMSGCANCVWIAYAQEVAKILGDGGDTARSKIIEKVSDPNLRAFLLLELSTLERKPD